MKAKFGPAKATTAAAHKLARTIYAMVTKHEEFDPAVFAKQDQKQKPADDDPQDHVGQLSHRGPAEACRSASHRSTAKWEQCSDGSRGE